MLIDSKVYVNYNKQTVAFATDSLLAMALESTFIFGVSFVNRKLKVRE